MEISSVTFFGSSVSKPQSDNYQAAYSVAKAIAKSGRRVVNGGGPGIMLAATTGAKEEHGKTTVVYYRPELSTTFEGGVAANHADEQFEEENYIERTRKLLELGDAYVIFKGGTGTISEFAMAWGLARLYLGHNKPLILFGNQWHNIIQVFKENMMIRKSEEKVYTIVTSADEVVPALNDYENLLAKNRHEHTSCTNTECGFIL